MRTFPIWRIKYLALVLLFSSGLDATTKQTSDDIAPESGTAKTAKQAVKAQDFIIAAAHPLATQAGFDVLKHNGNAIDAMVTVQAVLGLVEPQSSGLGGGAFLLYYDQNQQQLRSFDGRETAPLNAPGNLFMSANATPMAFFDAVVGGRSVGTPGTVKLLWDTHQTFGRHKWSALLAPAIKLAREGFKVSPRLANAIQKDRDKLRSDPVTSRYFFPDGQALKAGQTLRNPDYAKTLTMLAKYGGDYFYQQNFSKQIANKVQHADKPGYLSSKDFEAYRVIERKPVCSAYRDYQICGMGPPSSGALSVNATLGMLQSIPLKDLSPSEPLAWHYIAEASRLAFADRGMYIADPDFITVPTGLLSTPYLAARAKRIHPTQSSKNIQPGRPPNVAPNQYQPARSPEQDSTTHFVIVDQDKNIVSMTSTIENGFGSRLMVNGFLLNNELTDFSFAPTKNGALVANRVQAGKRPRSSMAPTIVFKGDTPYLALGSPGGSRIINYLTNSLIAILDWNMDLQQAFNLPHIVNRFGTMDIEEDTRATSLTDRFEQMGYKTSVRNLNSGLHGVQFSANGMIGAADSRREGLVLGQ